MDMRERHIGPIAMLAGDDGSKVKVDAGALVRRLPLFELLCANKGAALGP
jgi:hypothetical protein